ncbi:NAD-dependent protein deacylase [Mycoplasmatota bacterium]|nr:NAD-dependent protein deacylase [Mycoplasmatota bacterium]
MQEIKQFKEIIKKSKHIVFFGGAGVSVPSGIQHFRSASGIYQEKLNQTYTPEQMVSHSFFMHHTKAFFKFYFDKMIYPHAKPNACHIKLAKLEENGKIEAIITQNIDGLHQMAGSRRVIELHGSVHRNYCMKCGKFYDLTALDQTSVPYCTCGGIIKPDVVLYEEQLDQKMLASAILALRKADTLIIGGTSLVVYPAAGLVSYFEGKHIIVINLDQSQNIQTYNHMHILNIYDDIAHVFKQLDEETIK